MKQLIAICLTVVLVSAGLPALAQTSSGFGLSIQQLTEQVQAQIEKIRLAREQSEIQMSLARIRIAQQLERAEGELARQVEQMARLQGQLAEQLFQTEITAESLKNDIAVQLRIAASQIAQQIELTNDLIARLGILKDTVDDNPSAPCDPLTDPNCAPRQGAGAGQWWSSPAGASYSPPVVLTPSSTLTIEPQTPVVTPEPPMTPSVPAPSPGST